MRPEPPAKRTVASFDGQNLYYAAREAFDYHYPNYDPVALARAVCAAKGWHLAQVRFYTGVPASADNPFWHSFWFNKLSLLALTGVHVYQRSLHYRNRRVRLPNGSEQTFLVGEEKGIDVRIAIDVIRMAHRREYDVALISARTRTSGRSPRKSARLSRNRAAGSRSLPPFPSAPRASTAAGSRRRTGSGSNGPPTMPASTAATTARR